MILELLGYWFFRLLGKKLDREDPALPEAGFWIFSTLLMLIFWGILEILL